MQLEEWVRATAKKVEGRLAEDAERATTLRKRFDEGVQRYRKQVLDLVAAVNALIENEATRIHVIVLDNGLTLTASYKRIVTVEEPGPVTGVPACVGRVVVERENRKSMAPIEPAELYITSTGTQVALYHRPAKDLKQVGDAEYRDFVEFFAS